MNLAAPHIRIKCRPEDFVVTETAELKPRKTGTHTLYRLTKRGWNTVSALQEIAQRTGNDFEHFAYGGKKDKYALTSQYFTVEGRHRAIKLDEDGLRVEALGRLDRPMGPDLIVENVFAIVVRDLTRGLPEALARLEGLARRGLENYFDDQRFGGYDPEQGFLAEKVLKDHLNGAVKWLVTAQDPEDTDEDRARKALFFERWKDWEACRQAARTPYERKVFYHLCRRRSDFFGILKEIPRERLSLAIAAYQASIWNELLRRILLERAGASAAESFDVHPGLNGEYLFCRQDAAARALEGLDLPTLAAKTVFTDKRAESIHEGILSEIGVERPMFNKMKLRQAYFKSFPRPARIVPRNLSWKEGPDDLYAGASKLELSFALPRGSYATMLLKRLFAVPARPAGLGEG